MKWLNDGQPIRIYSHSWNFQLIILRCYCSNCVHINRCAY